MKNKKDWSEEEIAQNGHYLDRVISSNVFSTSEVLCELFNYLAEETFAGRENRLTQMSIAERVLGRDENFDPIVDSVVRVEVGRLRTKLREYYYEEGKDDAVVFRIPKGKYSLVVDNNSKIIGHLTGEPGDFDGRNLTEHSSITENTLLIPSLQRQLIKHRFKLVIGLLLLSAAFLIFNSYRTPEDHHADQIPKVNTIRTIAVLPFTNLSEDPNHAYFTDGIHDDILTQLAKISSLKVISRTSVMTYRDTQKSMKMIADELGVATLLEGGVQRAGNRVRINIQLIDTETDEHLWAETYNRELTAPNIFEIQEQIAIEIAAVLRTTLSLDVQARLKTVPTRNLEALQAYFLGRQHIAQRHSVALQEAIKFFQQAIALDPGFALAHVGLADSYQLQEDSGSLPRHEMFAKTEPVIKKALELDSQLGPAYNSLGGLRVTEGKYSEAEKLYLKSIELNPNYSTTYLWYGFCWLIWAELKKPLPCTEEELSATHSLPNLPKVLVTPWRIKVGLRRR